MWRVVVHASPALSGAKVCGGNFLTLCNPRQQCVRKKYQKQLRKQFPLDYVCPKTAVTHESPVDALRHAKTLRKLESMLLHRRFGARRPQHVRAQMAKLGPAPVTAFTAEAGGASGRGGGESASGGAVMAAGAPGAATKRLPDHLDSFRLTDRRRNVDPLAAPTPGTATASTGGVNGYNNRPLQEARFDSFQEIVIPADLPNPSLVLGDASLAGSRHDAAVAALVADAARDAGTGDAHTARAPPPPPNELAKSKPAYPLMNMSGVHHVSDRDIEHAEEGEGEEDRPDEPEDECDHLHGEDYVKPTELYELKVWDMYSREAEYNPTLHERLCECITRNPREDKQDADEDLCERGALQQQLLEFRNKCVQVFLFVLLFAYSPLASKTLRIWNCTEIGSTMYLAADFKIECNNSEWYAYACWAALSAVMYIVGIPYLFISLVRRQRVRHVKAYLFQIYGDGARKQSLYDLKPKGCRRRLCARLAECVRPFTRWWNRNVVDKIMSEKAKVISLKQLYVGRPDALAKLLETERKNLLAAALKDCADRDIIPSKQEFTTVKLFLYRDNLESYHTKKQLGFMYHAYSHKWWWYEVIYMIRKLLLNGAVIFVTETQTQVLLGMMICFGAVCAQQVRY